MAITFTTGTINAANAGEVGLVMAEKIRDDVVAHPAWDLVEEYAPGTTQWYVFKCLAASSGLPNDFYVIMGRTIGSGALFHFICEGYNSSTHVASKYVFNTTSSQFNYDSTGRNPSTYTLTAAIPAGSAGHPSIFNWSPSGVSTKWWLIVADDGFSVAFNGASNGFWHIGAYIPLAATPIPMPICTYSVESAKGHITHNPATANAVALFGCGLFFNVIYLGFPGRLDVNDKLNADQRPIAELGMWVDSINAGMNPLVGYALGKMKRIRSGGSSPPAGFSFGDAYVMQGRLWVPYHPTDLRVVDTGIAA